MRMEVAPFQKSLPQLRSAVNFAISIDPLGEEAPAIEALIGAREQATRADVRSRLSTLIRIARDIETSDLLPESLGDAIVAASRRANIGLHDLAKRSGASWKMHDWVSGRSMPDRFVSFGHVKKMEELAKVEPCTFWSRVRFRKSGGGTIPKRYWPQEIPTNAELKGEIKLYLPDDVLTMPEEERHETFLVAYGIVLAKRARNIDANHVANTKSRYRHNPKAWSASLAGEVERLFAFHKFKPKIDFKGSKEGTLWVKGTKERNTTYIAKFLGVMLTQRIFDVEELSLVLFSNPSLATTAVEFAVSRRAPVEINSELEPVKPYAPEDAKFLIFGKMLVSKGGFLRSPGFYEKLSPKARDMLEAAYPDVTDWNAICDRAFDDYKDAIERIAQWNKDLGPRLSRPKAKILPILDNDLHDYRAAFGKVLAENFEKADVGYRAWAYATTALVYHEMIAQLPHRSRAVRESTWVPDHTGSVRLVNGKWVWSIHWTQVKNARSSDVFRDKETHDAELKDINMLYRALHEYTRPGGARDWLLGERVSDRFFIVNSDEPEMDARKLANRVNRSTRDVLAKIDDPRWADVRSYSTHPERKLSFNAQLEPADSPTALAAYLRACGNLLITPRVAAKFYEYSDPARRAAGVAERLQQERRARS